jgi:hypothetical protein
LKLKIQNGLSLYFRELEPVHQLLTCLRRISGCSNELDDGIEMIQRFDESLEYMRARFSLSELESGTTPHHITPKIDE